MDTIEKEVAATDQSLSPIEDMIGRKHLFMPWTGNEEFHAIATLFGADHVAMNEGRLHDLDIVVAEVLDPRERILHRDVFEMTPQMTLGYQLPHFRVSEIEGLNVAPMPPYVAPIRAGGCYVRFIVPTHWYGRFLITSGKGESWSFDLVEPMQTAPQSGLIAVAYNLGPTIRSRCLIFNAGQAASVAHRLWLNHGHPLTREAKRLALGHGARWCENTYDAWGVIDTDLFRAELDAYGRAGYDDEGQVIEDPAMPYRAPSPYETEGSWQIAALGRDLHVFTFESKESGRILFGDRSRRVYA